MAASHVYESVPTREPQSDHDDTMNTTNPVDNTTGHQTATPVDTTERDLERGSDGGAEQNENKETDKDSERTSGRDVLLNMAMIPLGLVVFGVWLFVMVFLLRFGWSFLKAIVSAAWALGAWSE